jgi:hypothetical protein
VQADGVVVALYGDHGFACQLGCDSAGDLGFRRYRKVIGWVIFDDVHELTGYFCASCRRKLLRRYLGRTLLLGWWGVLALLYRNPYAIAVDTRTLFGPPRRAARLGATTLDRLDSGETLALGGIPDTWLCTACGNYFVGFDEARNHADLVHTELLREDARGALKQLTRPATYPS